MMNPASHANAYRSMERQKLLVVDDVPENFQALFSVLMADYDVVAAAGGEEALRSVKMHRPALILINVMMSGMDGYEVYTALKGDPGISDIPVIFITARSDAESETKALTAGAVDFIHKPFSKEVVRSRVRLHLELERRAAALDLANAGFTSHRDRLGELNRRKSGEIYWEEAHIAPVKDADGRTTHYVAVKLDIFDRKEAQRRLAYMAHHDPLTGLPNRSLFFDLVAQGLALARRNGTIMALMYIDLDKFKQINDNYGHEAGDLVLQHVARRMSECVRDSDSAARIGGDEFVALLQDVAGEEAAVAVAEKIRASLNQPFDVAGKMLSISSSIGIAIYPGHGSDPGELARNADSAMYYAKQSGRDNVKVFRAA